MSLPETWNLIPTLASVQLCQIYKRVRGKGGGRRVRMGVFFLWEAEIQGCHPLPWKRRPWQGSGVQSRVMRFVKSLLWTLAEIIWGGGWLVKYDLEFFSGLQTLCLKCDQETSVPILPPPKQQQQQQQRHKNCENIWAIKEAGVQVSTSSSMKHRDSGSQLHTGPSSLNTNTEIFPMLLTSTMNDGEIKARYQRGRGGAHL